MLVTTSRTKLFWNVVQQNAAQIVREVGVEHNDFRLCFLTFEVLIQNAVQADGAQK